MICERCKSRFGTHGVTYWNAKTGRCPVCEEEKNITTMFSPSHPYNEKK